MPEFPLADEHGRALQCCRRGSDPDGLLTTAGGQLEVETSMIGLTSLSNQQRQALMVEVIRKAVAHEEDVSTNRLARPPFRHTRANIQVRIVT